MRIRHGSRRARRLRLGLVAGVVVAAGATAPTGAAGATTTIVRPDGDVVRQWTGTPGTAWSALDDAVAQPAAVGAADYIYGSVAGRVTEVTLGNPVYSGTATVTPWFYANTGPGTTLRVETIVGTSVRSTTSVTAGSGFAWHAGEPTELTRAEAGDLRLRFTSVGGGDTNVRAAYAAVTAPDWQATWTAPGNSLSEWYVRQQPAPPTPARLTIATPPAAGNGTALRAELRDGDVAVNAAGRPIAGGWRAEVVARPDFASPTPVTYEWSTLLDRSYPTVPAGVWQVITQWHQGDGDTGGSPPIAFIIVDDRIKLQLHRTDAAGQSVEIATYDVAPLDRGTWHRFRMEVRWSLSDGYVKVWHDGQQKVNRAGIPTLFPPRAGSGAPSSAYLKLGIYRKAVPLGATFVIYHDEVRRLTPQ
jgi:hypothetical protein